MVHGPGFMLPVNSTSHHSEFPNDIFQDTKQLPKRIWDFHNRMGDGFPMAYWPTNTSKQDLRWVSNDFSFWHKPPNKEAHGESNI